MMIKSEYEFFIIGREHLKDDKTFPFQIYIFNPTHKKYSLFLNGNRPLTKELESFLDYLLDKGGELAILKKQRKTFLSSQGFEENDIPSLRDRELSEEEKERLEHLKLKEAFDQKNGEFAFQSEFEKATNSDNFLKLIEYSRMEILTFSVTHSPTVSLAIEFSKMHLIEDNYVNRIVATSYLLAKTTNINDQSALADVVCGAYLSHMGLTQLPLKLVTTPVLNLFDKDRKLYEKHTILGNHIIKKSGLEISERAKRIVLDHHERILGNGYPSMKYNESIEPLSQIVGSVAHIFEFSTGKINGTKVPIKTIIFNIKNKSFIPGLEFDFGEMVYNSLVTLINTDNKTTENKAA